MPLDGGGAPPDTERAIPGSGPSQDSCTFHPLQRGTRPADGALPLPAIRRAAGPGCCRHTGVLHAGVLPAGAGRGIIVAGLAREETRWSGIAAASATGRIRLRRRSSRREPPPSFYLRPGLLLPHLNRAVVALDRPPRAQMAGPAAAAQQAPDPSVFGGQPAALRILHAPCIPPKPPTSAPRTSLITVKIFF